MCRASAVYQIWGPWLQPDLLRYVWGIKIKQRGHMTETTPLWDYGDCLSSVGLAILKLCTNIEIQGFIRLDGQGLQI